MKWTTLVAAGCVAWTMGMGSVVSAQPAKFTIECTISPSPGSGTPPVVTPPVVVPPVVVPPVLPPEDNSPFQWPTETPSSVYYPDERYNGVGEGFYFAIDKYRNPLPGMLQYAGRAKPGLILYGTMDVSGQRLWAPTNAAPAMIRRVLNTGKP